MKRMVGSAIFNEYYPDRYYNHDAEDDDGEDIGTPEYVIAAARRAGLL